MTYQPRRSKNRRRKDRRRAYHERINAISRDPDSNEAVQMLMALRERYFRYVDGLIDGLSRLDDIGAFKSEINLVREIRAQILSGNDWVILHTADLGRIQVKADLFAYVQDRRSTHSANRGPASPAQRAAAVEHLRERAVAGIRMKHP